MPRLVSDVMVRSCHVGITPVNRYTSGIESSSCELQIVLKTKVQGRSVRYGSYHAEYQSSCEYMCTPMLTPIIMSCSASHVLNSVLNVSDNSHNAASFQRIHKIERRVHRSCNTTLVFFRPWSCKLLLFLLLPRCYMDLQTLFQSC